MRSTQRPQERTLLRIQGLQLIHRLTPHLSSNRTRHLQSHGLGDTSAPELPSIDYERRSEGSQRLEICSATTGHGEHLSNKPATLNLRHHGHHHIGPHSTWVSVKGPHNPGNPGARGSGRSSGFGRSANTGRPAKLASRDESRSILPDPEIAALPTREDPPVGMSKLDAPKRNHSRARGTSSRS